MPPDATFPRLMTDDGPPYCPIAPSIKPIENRLGAVETRIDKVEKRMSETTWKAVMVMSAAQPLILWGLQQLTGCS